jgi:hypothetical protein
VDAFGACAFELTCKFGFRSMSNQLQVGPSQLSFDVSCSSTPKLDSVQVIAKGADVQLLAPTLVQSSPAFTIVSPLGSFTATVSTPVWVIVRYDPSADRNAVGTLRLTPSDASGDIDVSISGTAQNVDWNVLPLTVDFTDLRGCDPQTVQTIVVHNNDSAALTIDVVAGTMPPWLQLETLTTQQQLPIVVGSNNSETIAITCTPSMLPVGTSNAVVELVDGTCGIHLSIKVSATRIEGALAMEPDPVDAGRVELGQSVVREVTIYNPTPEPRSIVDLMLPIGTAAWTLLDDVVGVVVQPSDTVRVRLQFQPVVDGAANSTLTMVQAERCTTSATIQLLGGGFEPGIPPQYTLGLSVDEYRVGAGDRVTIPVHWLTDVSAAGLDRARFDLDFSKLHYAVDLVTVGTVPDAEVQHSYANGKLTVTMKGLGPSFGKPGTVVIMNGIAAPALPDSTVFAFSKVQLWSRDSITIAEDPGLLIVDVCGPRNLILLLGPTRMYIAPPQPVLDEVYIGFDAPYTETASVEMVDAQGQVVSTVTGLSIGSGKSVVPVDVSQLVAGVYVVRVTTGRGGVFTAPVVVVR